jgi:Uma2 family endonuclease
MITMMPTWEEICDDPNLRDLPYKIEQDRYGRIVMSPAKPDHSLYQTAIARKLGDQLPGWAIYSECAIATPEGTKVPDAAAMSMDRSLRHRGKPALPEAPEICVEVLSWSNSTPEISEKRALLAALGCQEFWTCSDGGRMTFFNAVTGETFPASQICPDFPASIALPGQSG